MKDLLLQLLYAPIAQTIILAVIGFVYLKFAGRFPKVKKFVDKYHGEMIRIVKLVEVELSAYAGDNKSIHKLDTAVEYMILLIEKHENRKLSMSEKLEIKTNLSEVHHEIEPVMIAKKPTSV